MECVNVEHEEVLLVPRWVDCKRVTFKYGLGDEFIGVLETHMLGLDRTDKVSVRASRSPRATWSPPACPTRPPRRPDDGKTCAGTWVKGTGKDGTPREVYLHHVVDNEWSMEDTARRRWSGRRPSTR